MYTYTLNDSIVWLCLMRSQYHDLETEIRLLNVTAMEVICLGQCPPAILSLREEGWFGDVTIAYKTNQVDVNKEKIRQELKIQIREGRPKKSYIEITGMAFSGNRIFVVDSDPESILTILHFSGYEYEGIENDALCFARGEFDTLSPWGKVLQKIFEKFPTTLAENYEVEKLAELVPAFMDAVITVNLLHEMDVDVDNILTDTVKAVGQLTRLCREL